MPRQKVLPQRIRFLQITLRIIVVRGVMSVEGTPKRMGWDDSVVPKEPKLNGRLFLFLVVFSVEEDAMEED